MKSTLLGIASALVVSTAAAAADLVILPEETAAPFDWSGWYVGAHVGGASGAEEWTLVDNPGDGESGSIGEVVTEHDISGLLGGVQAGMNWQDGNVVYGIEGEFSLANISGDSARVAGGNNPGPREWSTQINWLATLGPRLGYAADSMLFYVEGGLAIANADFYHLGANGNEYEGNDTRFGGFAGAGIEYAFTDDMSARLEYNYVALGGNADLVRGANTAVFDISQHLHVVKAGVNFHF